MIIQRGYCWCVQAKSGRPIPASATDRHARPDCEGARRANKSFKGECISLLFDSRLRRLWPLCKHSCVALLRAKVKTRRTDPFYDAGCSAKKKQRFLSELILVFQKRMFAETNGRPFVELWPAQNRHHLPTRLEASKWKFSKLDANQSGALERREWREFRNEAKSETAELSEEERGLRRRRKCLRNFLRFCDANADRKVTMEEWLECTGVLCFALTLALGSTGF